MNFSIVDTDPPDREPLGDGTHCIDPWQPGKGGQAGGDLCAACGERRRDHPQPQTRHPPIPDRGPRWNDRLAITLANAALRLFASPWLRCRMHAVMVNGLNRGLLPDQQADELVRRAIGRYHPHD